MEFYRVGDGCVVVGKVRISGREDLIFVAVVVVRVPFHVLVRGDGRDDGCGQSLAHQSNIRRLYLFRMVGGLETWATSLFW